MSRKLVGAAIQQASGRAIIGFIDEIDESGIYGWAYDKLTPIAPVVLNFYIDDMWIAAVTCKAFRQDVADAGHPAGEVGFRAAIPKEYCDGNAHEFFFRDEEDQNVILGGFGDGTVIVRQFQLSTFFDVAFYAARYMAGGSEEGLSEYQHWKRFGAGAGHFPNPDALLAFYESQGNSLPADFSVEYYRFLNRDISDSLKYDWQAQLHYLESGRTEARPYRMQLNDFIIDLYFDGIKPAPSDILKTLEIADTYTSLPDLLSRNKITSDKFLTLFNFSAYSAYCMPVVFRTKLQCIRHFLTIGIQELIPIASDLAFDAAFYREAAGLEALESMRNDADSYRHWLNYGIDKHISPNGVAALRKLGLTQRSEFPAGFDHQLYRARNPDLEDLWHETRWGVLATVIESGLAEGRQGCPLDRTTSEIYRVAADRQAITRSFQSAKVLYEQVLAGYPQDTMALRHYADCLLQLGEHLLASTFYRKSIELRTDTAWTYLNLTTCLIHLKQWSAAADTICELTRLRRGDCAIEARYQDVIQQGFNALADEATWLAQKGFYATAKKRMGDACELLTRRLKTEPATMIAEGPVRRVAIIADIGLPQCEFYRVTQKCEQLALAGIESRVFDYMKGTEGYISTCGTFDALILYRVPAIPRIVKAVEAARSAGQPTFYEIDDLMFDADHFPASFESYGGQISHDLYASLVTGAVALKHALSICDYAIASTPSLAAAMEKLVLRRKAFVHRNGMGKAHQRSMGLGREVPTEEVRLFYGSGTKAHNEDFERELVPGLIKLFEKYGRKIRLVIMGYLTLPKSLTPYLDCITCLNPIWDIDQYWNVLRGMSINLAVLSPGSVADCKSEIKWMEAAMVGVPSVVTATATYRDVIRDFETGVLIASPKQWFAALDKLVAAPAKRRSIGERAFEDVVETYSLASLSENISTILHAPSGGRATGLAKRRKRVLVVNVFFAPQALGGATRVVIDNVTDITEYAGDEFEIEVFTAMEGMIEPHRVTSYRWNGIRVTSISTPNDPDIDSKVVDPAMGAAFEATVKRFAPDVIHFHCIQRLTTSICTVAADAGIPYFITLHDAWWISDKQFIIDDFGNTKLYRFADPLAELQTGSDASFARMMVKQKCLKGAVKLFAVSEPFAKIYRSCGFDNVVTIENGLPPFQKPERTISPDGRVRLAHIGGASFHKGYNLVMAVLCKGNFPNLHMLAIDHALDSGTERIGMWGATEVAFRSKVRQSDVGNLYAQVDVLLAPSIWPESYGLVAREALAAGCWVVASDRGAIGSDVPPGAGFVIDVGTHQALHDVFQEMNDHPERYTRSPSVNVVLREARQQAIALVAEYRALGRDPGVADERPTRPQQRPNPAPPSHGRGAARGVSTKQGRA